MDRASRLPSLNGLRAFEVSARAGSFRLAAEEMGVTPGAVAQQVRALEADLGLMLFHREGRGLVLTESGRGYAGHLPRAFVAEDLAAGKLVPCFDVTLRSGADFHLVLPRKARRAAEVLQVRDWLRSQARP